MILNNLSTGKPDAAVSLPLDENKWKLMPCAPWSTVNAFYRKMLYIQIPDTLATPQDMYMNGYAILRFVYNDDSCEDTMYSLFFDDIFNDDWIVGPNKDGTGGILAMEPIDLFNKRDSFQKSITESKLKLKLEEANKAVSQLQEKTVKLETNLQSKEQELTSVGKALADQKRTHQVYMKSKASEVKKLKQTHNETEEKLKNMSCALASSTASGQGAGPTFYEFMLRFVTDMQKSLKTKLDNISDNAQKKFMSTCKVNIADPDKIIAFRFKDHHNQWTLVDENVFQLLIVSYENKVKTPIKYKAYGQSYETTLKMNTYNAHGNSEFVFEQVNVATKALRFLEPVSRTDEAKSTSASGYDLNPKDKFTRMQMDEILFGDSCFAVDVKAEVEILNYMSLINNDKPDSVNLNHSYKETTDPFILKLSELVQLHSSMATGYKYLSPNGEKSKSALIIQPDVIRTAFRKAAQESTFKKACEKYDYMRLIFHGSTDYTTWLTKSFSFAQAGKNGEALGPGFYLAMSDEVATLYGNFKPLQSGDPSHGLPKGNMMASLCFTPKSPTRFKKYGELLSPQ